MNEFGERGWEPDWTIHPGDTLSECLEMRSWTQAHLARESGFSLKHINGVIKGHENISIDLALRLEKLDFGTADFWVRLDANHRLALARGKKLVSA